DRKPVKRLVTSTVDTTDTVTTTVAAQFKRTVGRRHSTTTGDVSRKASPAKTTRCGGLTRASTAASVPNAPCQAASATPPRASRPKPTTVVAPALGKAGPRRMAPTPSQTPTAVT